MILSPLKRVTVAILFLLWGYCPVVVFKHQIFHLSPLCKRVRSECGSLDPYSIKYSNRHAKEYNCLAPGYITVCASIYREAVRDVSGDSEEKATIFCGTIKYDGLVPY